MASSNLKEHFNQWSSSNFSFRKLTEDTSENFLSLIQWQNAQLTANELFSRSSLPELLASDLKNENNVIYGLDWMSWRNSNLFSDWLRTSLRRGKTDTLALNRSMAPQKKPQRTVWLLAIIKHQSGAWRQSTFCNAKEGCEMAVVSEGGCENPIRCKYKDSL